MKGKSTETKSIPVLYVIESPDHFDRLEGRNEGKALLEGMKHVITKSLYFDVSSKETFDRAIEMIFTDSDLRYGRPQIFTHKLTGQQEHRIQENFIHISCHGNEEGISLTDGSIVTWDELHGKFNFLDNKANEKGPRILLLSLSSCLGMNFLEFLKTNKGYKRYWVVTAPKRKIDWDEGLVFYSGMFRHLCKKTEPTSDGKSLIFDAIKYGNLNINFGKDLPFFALGHNGKMSNGEEVIY